MKGAAVAIKTDVLCRFSAPNTSPCLAYADLRNAHSYCAPHEQIYLHDCAVAFRRKARTDPAAAERWANSLGLPVDTVKRMAASLRKGKRHIALEVQ